MEYKPLFKTYEKGDGVMEAMTKMTQMKSNSIQSMVHLSMEKSWSLRMVI